MPRTAKHDLVNFRLFSPFLLNYLCFAEYLRVLYFICKFIMAKSKRFSNKMFYDSFGYFIIGETTIFLKFNFYALKLEMCKFCACSKMYIKAAAVPNDIKIAYLSKIDFEGNLFNKNCADLLSILFNHKKSCPNTN